MLRGVFIAVALAGAGCGNRLTWYAPPVQRGSLSLPSAAPFGYFVAMSDPNASAYVVGGFREQSEGPWRWTHEHPVLQFYVPRVPRLRFLMDVTFPDQTFAQTGPVEVAVRVNGRELGRVRFAKSGSDEYAQQVPWEWLHINGINTVALEPDKTAAGPGGERLGFVLTRAGFLE